MFSGETRETRIVSSRGCAPFVLSVTRPRAPRETPYLIRRAGDRLTLTPMAGGESELAFAGSMFRQGMEMMAHKA